MIRAILKNGVIQPIDPLPPDWQEGQELSIDSLPNGSDDPEAIRRWADELRRRAAEVPEEDHARVAELLAEQDRIAKDSVRKQMGLDE